MAKNIKKEKLLEIAIDLVSQNGYFNTSIEQLANKAGIAVGTVYLYFKNKDDILNQIFKYFVDMVKRNIDSEVDDFSSTDKKLYFFIKKLFETFENNPKLAKIILVELRQTNKKFYSSSETLFSIFQYVEKIIEEGIELGIFRENIDPVKHAIYVIGIIEMIGFVWIMNIYECNLMDQVNDIFTLLYKGLVK